MPRIVLISRVFPPEVHPTGIMVRELADFMALNGWDVHVVTGFPNHPQGEVMHGFRRAVHTSTREAGYTLHRTWHLLSPPGGVLRRAGEILSRAIATTICGLGLPADVVTVVGLPLLGALTWNPVARLHSSKLVNIVFDLYPDIAFESGRLDHPLVRRALRAVESAHWGAADVHVVLSEGFRRQLSQRGVADWRVRVLPVWLDGSEIIPASPQNDWRREQGIEPGRFVALYAGTIGVVSGAEVVVRAAARLRDRSDILFVMVGEGAAKARAEEAASDLHLKNIRFLPFQPRERLREVQAAANVGLVTLAPGRGRTSVPSKVLGYMAAARPIIAAVDGDSDTAREVREHDLGLVVPADDGHALANAVAALADGPDEASRLGQSARHRFEAHYTSERVLKQYASLFQSLLSTARGPR